MRVKIGDKWYDSAHFPICVELTPQDKTNIASMPEDSHLYSSCEDPTAYFKDNQAWLDWMKDGSSKCRHCGTINCDIC